VFRTKELGMFVLHAILALVVSPVLGGAITLVLRPLLGDSENALFDVPYGPLFWIPALLVAFLLNRKLHNDSAKWVWIVGLLWLFCRMVVTLRWYDSRWCNGCSSPQFIWYSYFSYRNCMQECLGQLLATLPMLSSVAYAIGASLGLKSGRHSGRQLTAKPLGGNP
jgi:hypothetical protein